MFRAHDGAPPLPDSDGPEDEGGATQYVGAPPFDPGWARIALGAAPVLAGFLVAGRAAAGWWSLPGGLLLLALAGSTPRRIMAGTLRVIRRGPVPVTAGLAGAGLAVGLWIEGLTLLSCAAGGAGLAPTFLAAWRAGLRPPPERTPPVKPSPDEEWRARVEDRWPDTAGRAGLHLAGQPAVVPALVGPPELRGPGTVHLRIDLAPPELAPEDVAARLPVLVRGLRARYVDVRPVDPHDTDLADVWLWRGRHPLDRLVTPADLHTVDDPSGEWVPAGRLSTGAPALLRWRLSTLITGAVGTGKTTTQVALLYGMRLQRIPLRLYVVDTLGDLAAWAPVLGDRYARTARAAVPLVERYAEAVQDRYDQLEDGEEVRPDRDRPALLLLITEGLHLRQRRAGFTDSDVKAVDVGLRYVTGSGRRAAAAVHMATQLPQKEEYGGLRDLLPQRVGHWVSEESMVDPALGSGALEKGARLHDLPASLKGAGYVLDPESRFPAMMRATYIPAADRAAVFGLRAEREGSG
jgi:hypothetical protein